MKKEKFTWEFWLLNEDKGRQKIHEIRAIILKSEPNLLQRKATGNLTG